MLKKFKKKAGFTLLELMTVLIIVIMLASVAFPIYQEYITRAQMAEAESIVSALETSQRAYFYANGTFLTTPPNPATVPGMVELGEPGTFGSSSEWTALGLPVAAGSEVNFSYQSFAGQTPAGSTTPTENDNLYNPDTDMDLERAGTYTASLDIPVMRQYAMRGFEFDPASLAFDLMAFAQDKGDVGKDTTGEKGDTGAEEKGDVGKDTTGEKGDTGAEEKGDTTGEKGDTGAEEKGDTGAEEKGDTGADTGGDTGATGDTGDSGDTGDTGDEEEPVIPCASFGVSKPTDFGVETGIAGYSWVVITAAGNLDAGTTCSLGVKVITVNNGEMSSRGYIQLNPGE